MAEFSQGFYPSLLSTLLCRRLRRKQDVSVVKKTTTRRFRRCKKKSKKRILAHYFSPSCLVYVVRYGPVFLNYMALYLVTSKDKLTWPYVVYRFLRTFNVPRQQTISNGSTRQILIFVEGRNRTLNKPAHVGFIICRGSGFLFL